MRGLSKGLIALAVVAMAMPAVAVAPPNPPSMEEIEAARHPPVVEETAPVGRQDPSAFVSVTTPPEVASMPVAAVVDMRTVPTTPDRDVTLPDRFHIQGEFRQDQSKDLAPITPGTPVSRGNPPVEVYFGHDGKAVGEYVQAFDGEPSSGWIPPDTVAAVGPEYIVEAVNSGFAVYTKTGTVTRSYTDFEGFVNKPTTWNGFCYDPRVVYSNIHGRFAMLILGLDTTNSKSYFWIMVSQTSDPNGAWWMWRWDVTRGSGSTAEWLDYAGLGVDNWGVYVTGNYFLFAGGYSSSALWSLDPSLMSGGPYGGGWKWNDTRWPNNNYAFSLQPAHPHTNNASTNTFFINTYSSSGTEACLWTLHGERFPGAGGDPVNLSRVALTARQYYAIGGNVDQPGSATDIDGGDCRIMNAVYSQGKVYASLTLDPDGDTSNSEAYILAVNTGDGTKAWDYTIWNSSYYIFYPSVSVQGTAGTPNWMSGFSMTVPSTTTYAGSLAFARDVGAGTNSFWWDRTGDGAYVRLDSNNRNRWGDYSMTMYDWTCTNMWSAQEYATSSNNWATRLFARKIGTEEACPYIHVVAPVSGTFLAGNTVSVTWEKMNIPSTDTQYMYLKYGSSWSQQSSGLPYTDTSYSWLVPNIATDVGQAYIGAWDGSAWRTSDLGDGTFTIVGCTLDGYESDNTAGTASTLVAGVSQNHTICTTQDEDWYRFTLAGPTGITLETSGPTGDTRMWLYDASVTQVEYNDDGGAGLFSFIDRVCGVDELPAGTYYVKVDEFGNNGHIADYSILLTTATCTTDLIFADGFETGDGSLWSGYQP